MRSRLISIVAAVVASAAACKTSPDDVDTLSVVNDVTPEGTRSLPADIVSAPLAAVELKPFTSEPVFVSVRNEGGVQSQRHVAAFDRYLGGRTAVFNPAQERGLALFIRAGCVSCHGGLYVGGQEYRRLGAAVALEHLADSGRFAQTRDSADLFVFKVPSLRNVDRRSAYFHDASVLSLAQAVRLMAHHQLARDLTEDQVADLRAFLVGLTGAIPPTGGMH